MALTDSVPSDALDVLKRNAEDLDKALNSTSNFTNRVGDTLVPVPSALSQIATAVSSGVATISNEVQSVEDAAGDAINTDIPNKVASVESTKTLAQTNITAKVGDVETARLSAHANINADVDFVEQRRVLANTNINLDVDFIEERRALAQTNINADVDFVENLRVTAQTNMVNDVNEVDAAKNNAIDVLIPQKIDELGLQYPPILYESGLTLDSYTKTYSYNDAVYVFGGALGTVTSGSFDENGWALVQSDIASRKIRYYGDISSLRGETDLQDGDIALLTSTSDGGVIGRRTFKYFAGSEAENNFENVLTPQSGVGAWVSISDSVVKKTDATGDMISRIRTGVSDYWGGSSINLVGDSISWGSNCENVFDDSYAGILRKMINEQYATDNVGFVSLRGVQEGAYYDIHTITPTGSWTEKTGTAAASSMCGYARSGSGSLDISAPKLSKSFRVVYRRYSGGGTFKVSGDGGLTWGDTYDTNGTESGGEVTATQSLSGDSTNIRIETVSGNVDVIGIQYLNDESNVIYNNFSQPGRTIADLNLSVIDKAVTGNALIWALGYNDKAATGTTRDSIISKIDYLIEKVVASGVKLYVIDLNWGVASNHWLREQLIRLGSTVSGAIYIGLPDLLSSNGSPILGGNLVNAFNFLDDANHPNIDGHRYAAETIAKNMGLSVTSKKYSIEPIMASTVSEIERARPYATGQKVFCSERANAQYELAPIGYVAQAGDRVAANGRVWALSITNTMDVSMFGAPLSGDATQEFNDALSRCDVVTFGDNYQVSGVVVSGSKRLQGTQKNKAILRPFSAGRMVTLRDNYSGISNCSFIHDRSLDVDAITIEPTAGTATPNSVDRWNRVEHIHAYGIKGSVVRCANVLWEQPIFDVMCRACGDSTNLKADIDLTVNAANNDSTNNITIDKCFSIFNNYRGFSIKGLVGKPIRKVRILNSMFHGGTDEGDLTTNPYSQIYMEYVEDVWVKDNNLTVGNDTVPNIHIVGDASDKSKLIEIASNTIASESSSGIGIKLEHCVDVDIPENKFAEFDTGTHIDIDNTNSRTSVSKQLIRGGSPLNIVHNAAQRNGYIADGEFVVLDEATLTGPKINNPSFNGASNFSFEAAITASASQTISLPSAESNTSYHVQVTTNTDVGYAWVTGKTTTGFTLNTSSPSAGVAWVLITR